MAHSRREADVTRGLGGEARRGLGSTPHAIADNVISSRTAESSGDGRTTDARYGAGNGSLGHRQQFNGLLSKYLNFCRANLGLQVTKAESGEKAVGPPDESSNLARRQICSGAA